MKIYTRKGDDGETGLLYGGKVSKNSSLPEAYGTVDEAQAILGLVRTECEKGSDLEEKIIHIERDLHLPRDGLDQLLLDHNFYEVHWQGENEAERIYTLQSEWFGDAKLAYAKLKDYFDQVGGIKQLDLEITTDFHRKPEGFPVAKVIPKGHIAES